MTEETKKTMSLSGVISDLLSTSKTTSAAKTNETIIAEQSKKIELLLQDLIFSNEANEQFRNQVFQQGRDLEDINDCLNTAITGKNTWIRRDGLMSAINKTSETMDKLHSLMIVERALKSGQDIHRAPIKSHKLEIVSGEYPDAGQWIVNKEEPLEEVKHNDL